MKMSSDSFHIKTEIESVLEMPFFNRETSGGNEWNQNQ